MTSPARATRLRAAAGIALTAVALAIGVGCTQGAPDPPPPPVEEAPFVPAADSMSLTPVRTAEMTEAEKRFGRGPRPDPSVRYQPEVVIVEGGAQAVQALDANGLGCTIDARSARASALRLGEIVFVTSRCVGRVIDIRREGDLLSLTLGPAEITEIVRDGFFEMNQPIDLGETVVYEAPEWPAASVPVEPLPVAAPIAPQPRFLLAAGREANGARAVPAGYDMPAGGRAPFTLAAAAPDVPVSDSVSWSNNRVIEAKLKLFGGGVFFNGRAALSLAQPRLNFVLQIQNGQVTRCELEFHGAASLFMGFQAGSELGANFPGTPRDIPTDITIPIAGPVPFSVLVRQSYYVQTVFTAQKSYLSDFAEYELGGSLTMGYRNGSWGIGGPTRFSVKQGPVASLNGASLGVTGMVFVHQIKIMVGVGAFGFATGPYTTFTSSIALTRHSDAEGTSIGGSPLFYRPLAGCKQATFTLTMAAGVGYVIPQPITDAINFILSKLNINHRIAKSGGLQSTPREILSKKGWAPDVPTCKL